MKKIVLLLAGVMLSTHVFAAGTQTIHGKASTARCLLSMIPWIHIR